MEFATNREKLAYIFGLISSKQIGVAYEKSLELGFEKNVNIKSNFYFVSDPDNRVPEWLVSQFLGNYDGYNNDDELLLESRSHESLLRLIKSFFDYQFGYEFGFGIEEKKETIEEDYARLEDSNE
ncbi:hypothetical protein GCM10008931_43520 [Oceanobacillus oncorhynchi subsp. oncorhynchi]|uniref:hypothetical protein n=1 Tax=Oceanobacillus oncorhynchi TaxID=545501 RepID=UPI0031CEE2CF